MTEIVSVVFNENGRAFSFAPGRLHLSAGDQVIVETQNGLAFGTVVAGNHSVEDDRIIHPLRQVLRLANEQDCKRMEETKKKEVEALKVCEKMVAEHGLDMKLVRAEIMLDSGKILFYFTSDGRVDFRELVKDLGSHFHTRIELRQIGVRDEAKMLGGIGICGQPYCCKRFLVDFQPVSIKMAKEQGLSLNPTKISGSCGRLMCCLNYEQNAYEYLNSLTPKAGSTVKTQEGPATVLDANPLTGILTVRLTESDSLPFKVHRDDVTFVPRQKKTPEKKENPPKKPKAEK